MGFFLGLTHKAPVLGCCEIVGRFSPHSWRFTHCLSDVQSGKKKVREVKEENVTLGPTVREGEHVFGVAHIFASFNDTFVVSRFLTPAPLHLSLVLI